MKAYEGLQLKKLLECAAEFIESERRLNVILDNVEAGIIVVSPEGIITFANRRMAEMFEMSLAELIDTQYSEHLHESEKRAGIESMKQIIDGVVKSVELDQHYLRKDGTNFWGHMSATRFDKTDGSMRDQIIVISNVTEHKLAEVERKLLEQQLLQAQEMENLGVHTGGIAHDFNNQLSVIVRNCYLAKLSPEGANTHISIIESAAERAAGLCRQMLTYAGKVSIDMAEVSVLTLVADMVSMLRSTIPLNVTIKFDSSTNIPLIKGDTNQLGQIVANLIINASEAIETEQGEILVSLVIINILSEQLDADYFGNVMPVGRYVCLEVTDNGCGMDEEAKQKIFDPFYTTKTMGRGLGMSAVLGIISSHNGALQLYSQPGLGTTFKIYLPSFHPET